MFEVLHFGKGELYNSLVAGWPGYQNFVAEFGRLCFVEREGYPFVLEFGSKLVGS